MDSESLFSSAACAPAYMSSQYTYLAAGLCDGDGVKFPDRSSPEPNSEAMLKALMALQRKIHSLESRKYMADENFQFVVEDTSAHESRHLATSSKTPPGCVNFSSNILRRGKSTLTRKTAAEESCSELPLSYPQEKVIRPAISCVCGLKSSVSLCRKCRPIHYRLNLRDLPFLLTASSSPSHSLTANYQQVLASMKSHTALCAVVSDGEKKQLSKIKSGFKSLLTSLEEELGQLTFEHQKLSEKLSTKPAVSSTPCELTENLKLLEDLLESKAKQINTVTRYIRTAELYQQRTPTHVHMHNSRDANIKFLQNLKAIRSTLQKEDLSWD